MLLEVVSKSDLSHFTAARGASYHEMPEWLLLHFLKYPLNFIHDIGARGDNFPIIS